MKHLDDREFAALAAGETDAAAAAHVKSCAVCAAEIERLRGFAAEFREAVAAAGDIAALRAPRAHAPAPQHRLLMAAVFAALVLASVGLLRMAPPQRVAPPAHAAVQKDVSDDMLLLEVDSDLRRTSPEALAPASLLLEARNKEAQAHTAKETR